VIIALLILVVLAILFPKALKVFFGLIALFILCAIIGVAAHDPNVGAFAFWAISGALLIGVIVRRLAGMVIMVQAARGREVNNAAHGFVCSFP